MNRRAFHAALACCATLWPGNGSSQAPPRRSLIGFLGSTSKASGRRFYGGFSDGMRELGYLEGRDYVFEERYADGDLDRLPLLAEQLVGLKPDLIVASNTAAAVATKRATATIPIVSVTMTDPIGMGLVVSEARPGTNVTGTLLRLDGLTGKQLEIASDLLPGVKKIGVLGNLNNLINIVQRREIESAAEKLRISLVPVEIRGTAEVGQAFGVFAREQASIVIVFVDAMFLSVRRQIAAFALASRLPTVFAAREHVEDGGLISYGVDLRANYRRAAYFVNRILKGEKPADLPVEFPTKLEMVVNNATAKALGITIPPSILIRADEVLE